MRPDETRTVFWQDGQVMMIDQRLLPHEFKIVSYQTYQAVSQAIRDMVVRGAPALGASAGFAMALAAHQSEAETVEHLHADLESAAALIRVARPTAVNLSWGVDRMLRCARNGQFENANALRSALLAEAQRIADEDVQINQRMGAYGAQLVPDQATIIHHCNTGSLATVSWGTALGVVRSAHAAGKRLHVLVDETRPRLQGARLTAWELAQAGIPHTIIADSASGHYLRREHVDLCVVGADRIAANGDTANKIGTYNLAVVAHENKVPFYVVAPFSTVDMALANGDLIEIEQRSADEVLSIGGSLIAPEGSQAGNPAFDVTPQRYISAIVTEYGIIYPPFEPALRHLAEQLSSEGQAF